jgi:lauroyl/myristoyl acyltransferase
MVPLPPMTYAIVSVARPSNTTCILKPAPPLYLPRSGELHSEVAALMGRVNAALQEWIRDRPELWLWLHRRWPD